MLVSIFEITQKFEHLQVGLLLVAANLTVIQIRFLLNLDVDGDSVCVCVCWSFFSSVYGTSWGVFDS